MKFAAERPYSDPEKAARKLVEFANSIEPAQEGRIFIELINWPFLIEHKGSRRIQSRLRAGDCARLADRPFARYQGSVISLFRRSASPNAFSYSRSTKLVAPNFAGSSAALSQMQKRSSACVLTVNRSRASPTFGRQAGAVKGRRRGRRLCGGRRSDCWGNWRCGRFRRIFCCIA